MKSVIVPVQTDEDIRLTATIAVKVWNEHYSSILSGEQIDYMLDRFQSVPAMKRQIAEDGYRYYLLVSGEPVGYMAVKEECGKLFLSKYYILKEHRGKGAASVGFSFIEKMAIESNLASIWLTVNKNNKSSIDIYRHMGYRIVKEQVADIGNGFVMDDYIMEKQICRVDDK